MSALSRGEIAYPRAGATRIGRAADLEPLVLPRPPPQAIVVSGSSMRSAWVSTQGKTSCPHGAEVPETGQVADVPALYDHDARALPARPLEDILHGDAQLAGHRHRPGRQRKPGAERASLGDRLERCPVCLPGVIPAETAEPHRQQIRQLVVLRPGNVIHGRLRQAAETVPVIQDRRGQHMLTPALRVPVERRKALPGSHPFESRGLCERLQLIVIAHGKQTVNTHGPGQAKRGPRVGLGLNDGKALPAPAADGQLNGPAQSRRRPGHDRQPHADRPEHRLPGNITAPSRLPLSPSAASAPSA